MEIPVAKPYLCSEEVEAVREPILSGWVTQGPKVEQFEDSFSRIVGARYAIATSSCTTALHLALIAANIKPGDEVICPTFSFIATANAICHAGAVPVFCDIAPGTINLDPVAALKLVTKRTKAILLVHQLGMPADIDGFAALCSEHGIALIEDAACAIGSEYKGCMIGAHSQFVCFSFHPRKVITTGDGGMITVVDGAIRDRLKRLRQHGMSITDIDRHRAKEILTAEYPEIGYNYRMTDIQAAVGIVQLGRLSWLVEERRKIAAHYGRELDRYAFLELPQEPDRVKTNYQSYWIKLNADAPIERDKLMVALKEKGISTRPGVMSIHREAAYRNSRPGLSFPLSEEMSDRSLLIPLFVPMTDSELEYVTSTLHGIFRQI